MNVRRRRLMRTLVRYRDQAGLTMDQAAEQSLCGIGTIHRMENGLNAVPLRVKTLLEIYGAPADVVAEMVRLARDKDQGGMVRRYRDLISSRFAEYLDLEADASEIAVVHAELVDPLLHTADYARALITAGQRGQGGADDLVELRMARQRRFTEADPARLVAVLGEAALHNQVGGPAVLRAQLEHLLELGRLANVTVQVLPFTSGAHPASGTNFALLGFPDQVDPDVVFTENLAGSVILDESAEVRPFQLALRRVTEAALGARQSAKLIAGVAAELPVP